MFRKVLLLILIFCCIVSIVSASPSLPYIVYGKVDGAAVPNGIMIKAIGQGIVFDECNPIPAYGNVFGGKSIEDSKLIIQGTIQDGSPITFMIGNRQGMIKVGNSWAYTIPYRSGRVEEVTIKIMPSGSGSSSGGYYTTYESDYEYDTVVTTTVPTTKPTVNVTQNVTQNTTQNVTQTITPTPTQTITTIPTTIIQTQTQPVTTIETPTPILTEVVTSTPTPTITQLIITHTPTIPPPESTPEITEEPSGFNMAGYIVAGIAAAILLLVGLYFYFQRKEDKE